MDPIYGQFEDHPTHLGPDYTAKTVTRRKLKWRVDMIKLPYTDIDWPFKTIHRMISTPVEILCPTDNYQEENIHAKLLQLAAHEQPSWVEKWLHHKHGIDSLGIEPEAWGPEDSDLYASRAEDGLNWGHPFWDMERLSAWGFAISPASTTVEE